MFFSSCESVFGDSLQSSGKSRFLMSLIGNTELLSMKCRGIGPHLAVRGKSHEFLDLRQAPGVYSRVTAGMAI